MSTGSLLCREHPAFQLISEDPPAARSKAHPFDLLDLKSLRLERRRGDQIERGEKGEGSKART